MESKLYNQTGEESGSVNLPECVFNVGWNSDLVDQVVISMRSNQREGNAHAKNRGEVSGGGKKPWRQKGTGRARHGSTRSPIWRHGGVTHGPRSDKNYARTVTKKMKQKALYAILSAKLRDREILFLDKFEMEKAKTKSANELVKRLATIDGFAKLAYKKGSRALFALPDYNEVVYKSFRNLPAVTTEEARNLNPLDALRYQYLVIVDPEKSLPQLEKKP